MLGARLHLQETEDAAGAAIELARSLGSTYVLIGTPLPRRGLGHLRSGGDWLIGRLLEGLPGVDIRIVADPALRGSAPLDEDLIKRAGVVGESDEGARERL